MVSKIPFGIYDIDKELLQTAHDNINEHVPLSNYEDEGRTRKFYCGPVCEHDGVPLFVPVSSQNKNERQNDYSGSSVLIKNKNESIGSLNFKYMVPVSDETLLTPRTELGSFGKKQAAWCMDNETLIKNKALANYNSFERFGEKDDLYFNYDEIVDLGYEIIDEREAVETEADTTALRETMAHRVEQINNISTIIKTHTADTKSYDPR